MERVTFFLLANLYVVQISYIYNDSSYEAKNNYTVLFILIAVVLAIVSLVLSLCNRAPLLADDDKRRRANKNLFIYKALTVPLNIVTCVLVLDSIGSFTWADLRSIVHLLVIPFLIGFAWIMHMAGAMHSMGLLSAMYNRWEIKGGTYAALIICQFVPFVDAVSHAFIIWPRIKAALNAKMSYE